MNQVETTPGFRWQKLVATVEPIVPGEMVDKSYRLVGPATFQGAQADLWFAEKEDNTFVVKFYRTKTGYTKPPQDIPGHPNILPIVGLGEHKGRPFEISPFCPLGSIDGYIREHPLSKGDVGSILKGMCAGVTALHNAGVQHRDIKPANLLVIDTDPVRIALSDFGSSGSSNTTTLTGVRGTLLYSAPEATNGMYSMSSDWWSVGVILLEFLMGKHPLQEMDSFQQSYAVQSGLIKIPDDIGPPYRKVIEALLHKSSSSRANGDSALQILEEESRPKPVQVPTIHEINGSSDQPKDQVTYRVTRDSAGYTYSRKQHKEGTGAGTFFAFLAGLVGLAVVCFFLSTGSPEETSPFDPLARAGTPTKVVQDTQANSLSAAEAKVNDVLEQARSWGYVFADGAHGRGHYDTSDAETATKFVKVITDGAGVRTENLKDGKLGYLSYSNTQLQADISWGRVSARWTGKSPNKMIVLWKH